MRITFFSMTKIFSYGIRLQTGLIQFLQQKQQIQWKNFGTVMNNCRSDDHAIEKLKKKMRHKKFRRQQITRLWKMNWRKIDVNYTDLIFCDR